MHREICIMMYEGRCPHCGNIVRWGHGTPMKRIGSPIRTCFKCGQKYVDENMYEWAVLNPVYKIWFYFGANNRGIVLSGFLIFDVLFFMSKNIVAGILLLVFSAMWMVVCVIYVKLVHKKAMIESQTRCNDPTYLQLLNVIEYDKLARKFDDFYKNK